MTFGETKTELKVGIFVFIGLIILIIFILSIGGIKTWVQGYKIKFNFAFVNGVKAGAPIRFAGVDVGQIKEVTFLHPGGSETRVELSGWVKKGTSIPVDSQVWINTLGLLGEKYVEIIPGKDLKNPLPAGDTLVGSEQVAMYEIAEQAKKIADDIQAVVLKIKDGEGAVGKLFSDDTLYSEIEGLILDLKKHPWKLLWRAKEK